MAYTLQEIIKLMYKYSSDFLFLSKNQEILGYLTRNDIVSLINQNFSSDEILALGFKNIEFINTSDLNMDFFPILVIDRGELDLISLDEILFYLTGDIKKLNIDYGVVVKSLSVPFVMFDRFGKIIFANFKMLNLLNLSEEEMLGVNREIFLEFFRYEGKILVRNGKRYRVFENEVISVNKRIFTLMLVQI